MQQTLNIPLSGEVLIEQTDLERIFLGRIMGYNFDFPSLALDGNMIRIGVYVKKLLKLSPGVTEEGILGTIKMNTGRIHVINLTVRGMNGENRVLEYVIEKDPVKVRR
mgnify:FL=1